MTRGQVRALVNNQHLMYICLTAVVLFFKLIIFIIINVGNNTKVLSIKKFFIQSSNCIRS